jgi:hypothetical protein
MPNSKDQNHGQLATPNSNQGRRMRASPSFTAFSKQNSVVEMETHRQQGCRQRRRLDVSMESDRDTGDSKSGGRSTTQRGHRTVLWSWQGSFRNKPATVLLRGVSIRDLIRHLAPARGGSNRGRTGAPAGWSSPLLESRGGQPGRIFRSERQRAFRRWLLPAAADSGAAPRQGAHFRSRSESESLSFYRAIS